MTPGETMLKVTREAIELHDLDLDPSWLLASIEAEAARGRSTLLLGAPDGSTVLVRISAFVVDGERVFGPRSVEVCDGPLRAR